MSRLTARDLMISDFVTIRISQTLGEGLAALLALQGSPEVPQALVVEDDEGRYRGMLTSRLLTRSLLALWMPERSVRESDALHDAELLAVVKDRLRLPVQDALVRGIPVVDPDTRLLPLIAACCDKEMEFVPVVADELALGLVPVTALFQATAALALTPGDEGIRFDQAP